MDLYRHFIISNLTADAEEMTKESDGTTKFLVVNIAVNEGKDQPATYFTAFLYDFSDERRLLINQRFKSLCLRLI